MQKFVEVALVCCGLWLAIVIPRLQAEQDHRRCVLHETCGRCLQATATTTPASDDKLQQSTPVCGWCTDPNYDWRRPRCLSLVEPANVTGCQHVYVAHDRSAVLDDREMRDFVASMSDENEHIRAVQIRPQRVRIALRRGQTRTVHFRYRPARNYPLDLYYLMDMTNSMEDDRQTLSTVASDLAAQLRTLTAGNARLGFGTFVDKPAQPFMATSAAARENPCSLVRGVCEKTYGFRHRLRLDRNVTRFVESVAAAAMSANLDNVEGGFDALMQVIVCGDRIGWRRQSRKIVVLATDGGLHFAGDGLLAGIVRPNDRRCHLDAATGDYTASLQQDYPSLAEMAAELRARKVSVIFAAAAEVRALYERVSALMADVSGVGELRADSSNVLQVVGDGYAAFVRRVRFYDDVERQTQTTGAARALRLRYEARCGGDGDDEVDNGGWVDAASCENVRLGGEYEFRVHVTRVDEEEEQREPNAAAAAGNNAAEHTIRVEEASLSSEWLQLDVELQDDCPCLQELREDELRDVNKSDENLCMGHGRFRCGQCLCDPGWLGKRCECNGAGRALQHQCRVPAEKAQNAGQQQLQVRAGALCSDRGECSCGECICNSGFTGEHCECEQCPYYRGLECGGPQRATCNCGRCHCLDAWSGPRCDCATSTATCSAPSAGSNTTATTASLSSSSLLCSGRGRCECGQCHCTPGFYGAFCESSHADGGGNALCAFYEPCVACLLRNTNTETNANDADDDEHDAATTACPCRAPDGHAYRIHWTTSGRLNDDEDTEARRLEDRQTSAAICVLRLMQATSKDGKTSVLCEHRFGYRVRDANARRVSHLRIAREHCTEPLGAAMVGVGVLVITFLLGFVILMAVKAVTVLKDRREFARFEEELKGIRYEEFTSPLYRSPNRMYEVPEAVRRCAGGGGINDFEMNDI